MYKGIEYEYVRVAFCDGYVRSLENISSIGLRDGSKEAV